MNKKEIGEIRRRLRRDRSNMTAVYGCYIRDNQEIISEFKASMGMLPENEAEKYLGLFKKTLGGSIGRTLHDITFSTRQVADREERYATLCDLRQTRLENKETRMALYHRVMMSVHLECNYLILLGYDTYDVPFKSQDADGGIGDSEESYHYIVCAICPVRETKPNLHYVHQESTFHDGGMMQAVNSPVAGFLFPAFDMRSTNLYGALYFNQDTSDNREELVDALFGVACPVAADVEKAEFASVLTSSLGDACNLEVICALHEQARFQEQMHAEARTPDLLLANKQDMQNVLSGCGVDPELVKSFGEAYDEAFGADSEVSLQNILDTKRYVLSTPDVVIKVAPDRADDIEMRDIGGQMYVLVPVEEAVEVNNIVLKCKTN